MSGDEERDARELAAFLEGAEASIDTEEAETIGLFRHSAGTPALGEEASDRAWAAIRDSEAARKHQWRARSRRRTSWITGMAVAAVAALALLVIRPQLEAPALPATATPAEWKAARDALSSGGPVEERLEALQVVSRRERLRLNHGLQHGS